MLIDRHARQLRNKQILKQRKKMSKEHARTVQESVRVRKFLIREWAKSGDFKVEVTAFDFPDVDLESVLKLLKESGEITYTKYGDAYKVTIVNDTTEVSDSKEGDVKPLNETLKTDDHKESLDDLWSQKK